MIDSEEHKQEVVEEFKRQPLIEMEKAECDFCKMSYSLDDLDSHEQTCDKRYDFKCCKCNVGFNLQAEFDSHIKAHDAKELE